MSTTLGRRFSLLPCNKYEYNLLEQGQRSCAYLIITQKVGEAEMKATEKLRIGQVYTIQRPKIPGHCLGASPVAGKSN